jgi:phenylalanyl-tRNA synthetase alpha chain
MDETMSSSKESDYAAIEARWQAAVSAASDPHALEAVRVEALGKKGEISQLMKGLGGLDPDARREAGQQLNRIKDAVQAALEARKTALDTAQLEAKLATEIVDVTLPPRPQPDGRLHPISQTIDEIVAIFGEMGFSVAEGPDIEDDFHNFTALNIPPDHPARQMHDTFYLATASDSRHANPIARGSEVESGAGSKPAPLLLRTHTSPVQIRHMKSHQPPIRIIAPGRTYRSDSDMTHTPMFHQVEGLVIDETTHMGHLKGCLIDFCRTFFGIPDLPLRFRPSFFPFTEPSAEVDIGCSRKGGELKLGNFGDWLEILGCGMVHPKVLAMGGIDPAKYQGFAFGMGIERIAMLKYGIPDLRTFYEADLRWLRHYGFAALDVPSLTGGIAR